MINNEELRGKLQLALSEEWGAYGVIKDREIIDLLSILSDHEAALPLLGAAKRIDKKLAIKTLRRLYHPMFQEEGRPVSVPIFDAIMPILEALLDQQSIPGSAGATKLERFLIEDRTPAPPELAKVTREWVIKKLKKFMVEDDPVGAWQSRTTVKGDYPYLLSLANAIDLFRELGIVVEEEK